MPGYIGYAPQFNPISLQDYLAVPNQIYQEQQAAADKVEQYQDQLSYYKNLLGDEGAQEFADYDRLMSELGNDIYNQRTGNLLSTSRKLRKILRDIGTKVDIAKTNRDKYQAVLDKDPSLIGELGSMYSWYKDPDQIPRFISSKDLASQIGGLTKNTAAGIEPKLINSQEESGIDYYQTGIDPYTQNKSLANAISGNITNEYEGAIRQYLDGVNYDTLTDNSKKRIIETIKQSISDNSGYGLTPVNRLALEAQKASTSLHNAQASRYWQDVNDNKPESWTDLGVTTYNGRHYKYTKRKHASGYLEVTRTPIDANGKIIGNPEPAPYYYRSDGTKEDAVYSSAGLFGKSTSETTPYIDNTRVVYTTDGDGKSIVSDMSVEDIEDDTENFVDIDMNDSDQKSAYNKEKNKYLAQGYSEDQLIFKWDNRKKKNGGQRVIVIVNGVNQKTNKDTKNNAGIRMAIQQIKEQGAIDWNSVAATVGVGGKP